MLMHCVLFEGSDTVSLFAVFFFFFFFFFFFYLQGTGEGRKRGVCAWVREDAYISTHGVYAWMYIWMYVWMVRMDIHMLLGFV